MCCSDPTVIRCERREGSQTSPAMKPFVAVAFLVAASLTAASAAPALQKQEAHSSRASRSGQSPSLGTGSRFPDYLLSDFVAPPAFLQSRFFSPGPFGGPRVQGPALYFPGQIFYVRQVYGNGFGWGSAPLYGSGFWSPFPGYGGGYGYGSGYSGFLPGVVRGYGNNGAFDHFGGASGSVVLGQNPAAKLNHSRGSRSSPQSQARRQ